MIFKYTFYDPETGRILSSGMGAEMPDWADCVEGIHMPDMFINIETKQVVKRPGSPVNLDGLVLKNVPENSVIWIDSEAYESKDGGEVELRFTQKGIYHVRVESWPYLDKEFIIDYQP